MADWKDHLREAVRLKGSQSRLAEAMREVGVECSQSKISWLLVTADKIDAEDALALERVTEGAISKSQLRPDLWPPESAPVSAGAAA